jgi:hypothetical protein
MAIEMGEAREAWGWNVWRKAEDFANNVKADAPFYVVYSCKEDKPLSNKTGTVTFRQAFKAYHSRPPSLLGILVWFVDRAKGLFEFTPELSAPYDIPLDPRLLSDNTSDTSERVANQGNKMKVLVS